VTGEWVGKIVGRELRDKNYGIRITGQELRDKNYGTRIMGLERIDRSLDFSLLEGGNEG
jgi:hypothetical protein